MQRLLDPHDCFEVHNAALGGVRLPQLTLFWSEWARHWNADLVVRLDPFAEHFDSLVGAVQAAGAVPILVTHAMRFGGPLDGDDRFLLD